jgi:uncharacterized damage-inducible protein DinB
MIADIGEFLRYFDGVNKRAIRDVTALPAEAETWRPATGDGENAWSIGEIAAHMATSRLFFTGAFEGAGWVAAPWDGPSQTREDWVALLNDSAARVRERLGALPPEALRRKVDSIDTPGLQFSAWRLLMMMVEHDVHHRSQVQTYVGIMGWPVTQIFGRTAEQVGLLAVPPKAPKER